MSTKIPPHIARELRRHVQKSTKKSMRVQEKEESRSKIPTLIGCTIFTGIAFSVPFVATHWIGSLNERDGVSTIYLLQNFL